MTLSVSPQQRHVRPRRCPICDGADGDVRGRGVRCNGFTSSDGLYEHCSREEFAGAIEVTATSNTFAHRLQGPCKCGQQHGSGNGAGNGRSEILATYDYTDEGGALLFQVVRKSGKRFLQRKPDGAGGWIWKLGDVRRVLYRLRELVEDDADRTVYVVEGEKDAETLAKLGHLATCNPGGAGKWNTVADLARTALQGRDVIVIADRDEVGRSHARQVAASLQGLARSLSVVECPAPHKDVSDLLDAGGKLDELVPLDAKPSEAGDDVPIVVELILPRSVDSLFTLPGSLYSSLD